MSKAPVGSLGETVDGAIQKYIDDHMTGDINLYLDSLGINHPHLQPGGEFQPRAPICTGGTHAVMHSYYNKHDGEHIWWTCDY